MYRLTPYGHRGLFVLVLLIGVLALSGCQTNQVAPTPGRAIVMAAVALESVADLTVTLNESGAIPDSKRAEVRVKLDQAYALLETAREQVGTEEGVNALDAVDALLRQVRSMIAVEET